MGVLALVFVAFVAAAAGLLAQVYAPDRSVESLSKRWAHPPSRFVEVAGQRVHVRDEGRGRGRDQRPVVLIHGVAASLHTWEGWASILVRNGFRVIRFDLPAFGLTGPFVNSSENAEFRSGDYRSDTLARFTWRVLDAVAPEVEQFVLAGNSLGGEVAWRAAAAAPERVANLVLISPSGVGARAASVPVGFYLAQFEVSAWLFSQFLPRWIVRSSVENVYGDPSRVTEAIVDRYYELALREGNRWALLQRMQQRSKGDDLHLLESIPTPTLVLWGGRDRLIVPRDANVFLGRLPDAQLVTFEDMGHTPMEEEPLKSIQPVLTFLRATRSQA
jgi:pimeloyl-ACP methyl ester carboxylesterase